MKIDIVDALADLLSCFPPEERPRMEGMIKLYLLLEALHSECVVRDNDGQEHRGIGIDRLEGRDPTFVPAIVDYVGRRYLELQEPRGSA
jgi:hypothetical protein